MTTPKSPEDVMKDFKKLQEDEWFDMYDYEKEEWLRSSMASLLCYMAERMQIQPGDDYGYSTGIEKAESILIEEAKKITGV